MTHYEHIDVRPLTGALGAEVLGVDLSQNLSNATFDEIHRAFGEHAVLVFRDQDLTPDGQKAFCRRFGPLQPIPFVKTLDEHPEVIAVIKEADERTSEVFGGTWHSDFSFLPEPPLASCLYAIETPPQGGDTLFASMDRTLESLSQALRATLATMRVVHSGKRSYGTAGRFSREQIDSIAVRAGEDGDAEISHPVIRHIPETGGETLFVNDVYTIRFEDMTEEESTPLLRFLYQQARRPEHTCRVSWRPGSLALWDNRRLMHYAINDYDGFRREMHRVTIAGEKPIAA